MYVKNVLTKQITSDADLDAAIAPLLPVLELNETEESWDHIDQALAQLQALTKNGATKVPSYMMRIQQVAPCITRSVCMSRHHANAHMRGKLLSERTRLSGTASDLLNSMAPRLAECFSPFVSVFIPPLLQLCGRTNKVALRRAEKSLHLICRHCRLPNVVPYLIQSLMDKSGSTRASAAECLVVLLESCDPERLQRRVKDVEHAIQLLATDANPQARALCRQIYGLYAGMWPARCASFFPTLSPTARRYLAAVQPVERLYTHDDVEHQEDTPSPIATHPMITRVSRIEPRQKTGSPTLVSKTQSTSNTLQSLTIPRTPPTPLAPSADPFERTGVPPVPPRGSNPSDGVAYRLALAREQAKLRATQRLGASSTDTPGTRLASRALARSSASIGSARRVVVGRSEPTTPTTPQPYTVDKKNTSPFTASSQFTPKRRPFSVVNQDRSPQARMGLRTTHANIDE